MGVSKVGVCLVFLRDMNELVFFWCSVRPAVLCLRRRNLLVGDFIPFRRVCVCVACAVHSFFFGEESHTHLPRVKFLGVRPYEA